MAVPLQSEKFFPPHFKCGAERSALLFQRINCFLLSLVLGIMKFLSGIVTLNVIVNNRGSADEISPC